MTVLSREMWPLVDEGSTERRRYSWTLARAKAARTGLAAALLVASAGMPGCKVGPAYERPDAPLIDAWSQPTAGTDAQANVRWWESFADPTLTALTERALEQNLSLKIAGLRVLEARAARGIAVGDFFPQSQEAFGAIDTNRLSRNDAPGSGDRSFSTDSLDLQAAWELDFWGKFRRGIEAADAEVQATVADYDAAIVVLVSDIAANYILIRSLEERLVFARANADLQAETLDLTERRFRAGAVSELDVSTARSTLANTRALIPNLENELRQTKLAIAVLLGRPPSELESELSPPDGRTRTVPEAPAGLALGIPAELLRRRPDVRSAERFAAAQSARIGQATADLYPRISITGATGFASSNYDGAQNPGLGDIFDADSFAGFIGLQVNWPIFNYGRIEGNIRVQDARYEQAVVRYQDSVIRAAAEVESGLSDFLRARERTTHLKEAVDASRRSAELSLIQYRAGAVDFIRVNQAQTDLVVQQDALVTARAAIALGAVRSYRALGGGWEVREGHEFVDGATGERMRRRTDWGDILSPDWSNGRDLGFPRSSTSRPEEGAQE